MWASVYIAIYTAGRRSVRFHIHPEQRPLSQFCTGSVTVGLVEAYRHSQTETRTEVRSHRFTAGLELGYRFTAGLELGYRFTVSLDG